MLLRPRTGLQDMTVEIDSGHRGRAGRGGLDDPARADRAQRPARPDPRLARRRHPRLPAAPDPGRRRGARRPRPGALGGAAALRAPGPRPGADQRRAWRRAARTSPASITSFRSLTEALGAQRHPPRRVGHLSERGASASFANQEASAARAAARAALDAAARPGVALESGDRFALELGPASRAADPGRAGVRARPSEARRTFSRETVGPIRDQIRPFTREVQRADPPPQAGVRAARRDDRRDRRARSASSNRFFNAWAYNPPGPEEGYLFWTAWLNHNTNNIVPAPGRQRPAARAGSCCSHASPRSAPRSSRSRGRSSSRSSSSPTCRRARTSAR